jgi:hypothetical protein
MSKKINKSEVRVLSSPGKTPISINHILDTMYSSFSFQVLQRHVLPVAQKILYDKIINKKSKVNIDLQKKAFLAFDEDINRIVLNNEISDWVLLQNKHSKNKNYFLPVKTSDYEFLREILNLYFTHRVDIIGSKLSEKEIDKLSNKTIKTLNLDKTLSFLNKYHTPPLLKKEVTNHKVVTEESKELFDVEKANGKKTKEKLVYIILAEKNKAMFSYKNMFISYELQNTDDVASLRFQFYILKEEYETLKKKFIPKTKINVDEAIFQLLTFYEGFGYLYNKPFARGLLNIQNKELKKLQDSSTILIGTPFNSDRNYFSLFPNVEQHFGSSGSFFDVQLVTGTYSLLPPPSYVFLSYCIDRVRGWLEMAKKEKRKIRILFWYPHMYSFTDLGTTLPHFESNDNTRQDMIYNMIDDKLLKRLENINYNKKVINYSPDGEATNKNYTFKVFIYES